MESKPYAQQLRVFGLGKDDFDTHIPESIMALKRAPSFEWALCYANASPFRVSLGISDQVSTF